MAKTRLSGASYVQRGYGQVEPNHLSAQRTAQIYAQLPADADIDVLENGQFVKYDYRNEVVNFTGAGEWMLVFNEVKLYRDGEQYDDFAMKKTDYVARVYSPVDGVGSTTARARDYRGTVSAADPYEIDSTNDPFNIEKFITPKYMPKKGTGTDDDPYRYSTMVPRVFKTNIGDLFTTNTVNETTLALGDILYVGDDGYLTKTAGTNSGTMQWQVVKVYTLADRQPAVKVMRIA